MFLDVVIFLLVLLLVLYVVVSAGGALMFTRSASVADSTTPAYFGLDFEEVSFPAAKDNLAIRGWFVPARSKKVILVVHGLGANRGNVLEPAVPLVKAGFNLLVIDLRGHGASDGKVCSYGYYEQRDILGALTYLKQRGFGGENIGVLAYSMGAATALTVMAQTDAIRTLVVDSAFADLCRELKHAFRYATGGYLPRFCLPGMLLAALLLRGIKVNAVRPEEAIKHLNGRRLLIIHGDSDLLVPVENAYILKEAAGDAAQLWIVPRAGHVASYDRQPRQYINHLLNFFQREL
jgi:pimeloyl-ACP methyl ester carboxylesterase